MKMKRFLFTYVFCFAALWAIAGNGEGNCGVYLSVNGESQNYRLSGTDWGNNDITAALNNRPELNGTDLGTIKSLTLCGGQMTAWANENDYYESNSFRVQYRVYKQGETAPDEWETLPLTEETYRSGNDYRYEATNKTIDLRAMTDGGGGTWIFEAKMLGHKYWNNGNSSGSWDTDHDPETATFSLPSTYYISGAGGNDANGNWCDGKDWTSATDVTMTGSSHTFYNVAAGTYGFKVTNGAWGTNNEYGHNETDLTACDANVWSKSNNNISITTDATSDITINFNAVTGKVSVTSTLGRFVRTPYSVVGDPVLGINWEPSNTQTEMVRLDNGHYQYIKENITLEQHNGRQFKIVGGHDWGTYQAPASGDFTVDIPADGIYNLVFDFDPATDNATCTPLLTQEITISAYRYNTFYSDKAYDVPTGLTAYIFNGVDNDLLTMQEINPIPANTGVLLFGTANAVYTLTETTTADTYSTNLLKGSLNDENINNANVHYILSLSGGQFGFFWPMGTSSGVGAFTNKAGKAYIELPGSSSAPVRGFILSAQDEATGLEEADTQSLDNAYYDLLGRKITNPQQGGIYIHNGKKVVIVTSSIL